MHDGGRRDSWRDCSPRWLTGRLRDELAEFRDVLHRGMGSLEGEAADVANFLMMIVEVKRERSKA